jgi:hypothetical protein
MTVDVLLLMEITSVFVLRDLMVQNVKVAKAQCSCFIMFMLQIKLIVGALLHGVTV